jgi:hypothetical protein
MDQPEAQRDTEYNRIFRTHAGYLTGFRTLAAGRFQSRDRFLRELANTAITAYEGHIKRNQSGVDEAIVRSCLHRAWGTETILCTTAELSLDANLTRLALAWGAVQTYYACYGACQACLVAEGKPRSENHNTTQNQVVGLWVNRAFSLAPWSLAAVEPGTRNACASGFLNGPGRPLDMSLHAWAYLGPGQEWDRAGKALRTTREDRVTDAIKRARENKRKDKIKEWNAEEAGRLADGKRPRKTPEMQLPRLTPTERESARTSVRPFTILDYLYRLRIKANYIDDDLFSQGPEDDSDAVRFGRDMQDVVASTLLVHELRLSKLLGPKWVLSEAESWMAANSATSAAHGLAARRELLASV